MLELQDVPDGNIRIYQIIASIKWVGTLLYINTSPRVSGIFFFDLSLVSCGMYWFVHFVHGRLIERLTVYPSCFRLCRLFIAVSITGMTTATLTRVAGACLSSDPRTRCARTGGSLPSHENSFLRSYLSTELTKMRWIYMTTMTTMTTAAQYHVTRICLPSENMGTNAVVALHKKILESNKKIGKRGESQLSKIHGVPTCILWKYWNGTVFGVRFGAPTPQK